MTIPVSSNVAASQIDPAETPATTEPGKKSVFAKAVSAIASAYSLKTVMNLANKHRIPLAYVSVSAVLLGPIMTLAVLGTIGAVKTLIDQYRTHTHDVAAEATTQQTGQTPDNQVRAS